jgi:hypothetical protein
MPDQEIVTSIRSDNIDTELVEDSLMLVACILDIQYLETIEEIKSVAVYFGSYIKVCYALVDMFPYFEKQFSITGTPTFLLIKHGYILDTLLGKNSAQDLVAWIKTYVEHLF